ncbi:MAG TPA: TonB family protein [Lentimicrobium sp.]|nr:TonB family protein [Lentimicrobium sp.]
MENSPVKRLFEPSGCLSAEGLERYCAGFLTPEVARAAADHISECAFCAMAAEGYSGTEPGTAAEDLSEVRKKLQGELFMQDAGKLHDAASVQMVHTTQSFRPSQNSIPPPDDNSLTGHKPQSGSPGERGNVLYRYLAVAGILVLIAVGARFILLFDGRSLNQQYIIKNDERLYSDANFALTDGEVITSVSEEGGLLTYVPPPPLPAVPLTVDDARSGSGEAPAKPAIKSKTSVIAEMQKPASMPAVADEDLYERTEESITAGLTVMEEETDEEEIFVVVEQMPGYPGGQEALHRFLAENIRYPKDAREAGIHGTVYVTFVVGTDGRISNIRILRGLSSSTDREVIRVLNLMPAWKPGYQRGKPVRTQFAMPVRFTLAG